MNVVKTIGVLLLLLHCYLLLETFFWQEPIMPLWRFFLGVFGSILGIIAGLILINLQKK